MYCFRGLQWTVWCSYLACRWAGGLSWSLWEVDWLEHWRGDEQSINNQNRATRGGIIKRLVSDILLVSWTPLSSLSPLLFSVTFPTPHCSPLSPCPPPPLSIGPKQPWQEKGRGEGGENSDSKNVARLSSLRTISLFSYFSSLLLQQSRQSQGCIPGKETEDPSTPPFIPPSFPPSLPFSVCLHILHFPSVALTGHFLEPLTPPPSFFFTPLSKQSLSGWVKMTCGQKNMNTDSIIRFWLFCSAVSETLDVKMLKCYIQ